MAGGQTAGRLWLDESENSVRVIDLALLPEQQGRGIGTHVLRSVIRRAGEAGRPVCLTVARTNERAFGLYRRLGFVVSASDEVYVEMCRTPDYSS